MAEKISGTLTVSDDVLADLVGYAAKECYGVVGMAAPAPASVTEGLVGLLPAQRLRRGIEIDRDGEGKLSVALHVVLEYGVNLTAVSQNLVDAVQYVLKNIARIDDARVIVHVDAVKVREA
jgi:uncharacterized alkaline shock family protein YloU